MAATQGSGHAEGHSEHHGPPHDIWQHMTREERQQLKRDDSEAWSNVVGVLLTIVVVGVILAVITVLISA
jgi:hypothetical protein